MLLRAWCAKAVADFSEKITPKTGTSAHPGRFRCMWTRSGLIFASLLITAPSAAVAQAPPSPATPQQQTAPPAAQRSSDCVPAQPSQPRGSTAPEGSTIGQAQEPLGDRLAQSNGVLCPPAGVDPEMRAPTPNTGRMPVIPPPDSPGGNPNVKPK